MNAILDEVNQDIPDESVMEGSRSAAQSPYQEMVLAEARAELDKQVESLATDALNGNPRTTIANKRLPAVIEMRFFQGLSLEKTGKQFGVTRERIRQMEARALRMMRHPQRINALYWPDTRLDGEEADEKRRQAHYEAQTEREIQEQFGERRRKMALKQRARKISLLLKKLSNTRGSGSSKKLTKLKEQLHSAFNYCCYLKEEMNEQEFHAARKIVDEINDRERAMRYRIMDAMILPDNLRWSLLHTFKFCRPNVTFYHASMNGTYILCEYRKPNISKPMQLPIQWKKKHGWFPLINHCLDQKYRQGEIISVSLN